LAVAALIAIGVLVYTLAFRRGENVAPAATNASAGANAAMSAGQDQQAAIAAAEARIQALQEALRRDPDNHQAWFELGQLYREFDRFAEAAQAFRRAAELQPRTAIYNNYLGEALIFTATRTHQPLTEAERYLRRALELEPGNAMSRFYLATIKDERGDHRGAVEDLVALLRDPPGGEPLPPQVRGTALSLAQQHNIDISGRLPPEPAATAAVPAQSAATAAIPGPTPEQMRAAGGMTPTQQSAMGREMVERLAARLRQNPRDADRWMMLMRSRMVLNEPQRAAEALRSGLAAFPDDPATQTRLREAAQQLGVPGA
jgi:cytochrome c-type biogenesis protein CcmH